DTVGEADVTQTSVDTVKTETAGPVAEPEKEKDRGIWSIFLACILGGIFATITPCVFPMIPMTVSFFLKQSNTKARGKFNAFFYGFCIVAICVLLSVPFHIIEGLNRDIFSEI